MANRRNLHGEERMLKLEDELFEARTTVISLLPESTQDILESYYSLKSRHDLYVWLHEVARKIAYLAQPRPAAEMGRPSSSTPRASCPLCGEGCVDPFGAQGFAFPKGLLRHLRGSHSSTQCRVFSVAKNLAFEHAHDHGLPER